LIIVGHNAGKRDCGACKWEEASIKEGSEENLRYAATF